MCRKLARFQRSDRGVQRCSTFMAFEAHVERAERSAKRHDRSGNVTRRCGPACTKLLPESRCLVMPVVTCTVTCTACVLPVCCLCAYLPHDNFVARALMNRFYSHGADSKTKKSGKTRTAGKAGTFGKTLSHQTIQSTRTETVQAAIVRQDNQSIARQHRRSGDCAAVSLGPADEFAISR